MIVLIVKGARAFVFAVHFFSLFQLKMYDFLVEQVSPPGILMYQENPQWNGPLSSSKFAVIVEAALESPPQFVIQLYAMAVQQE